MSNDLVVPDLPGYEITSGEFNKDETALARLAGGGFLPYIQLVGGSSKLAKTGSVPIGVYVLVKNRTPIDMGKEFKGWVIQWRPRAMKMAKEGLLNFFDPHSKEFIDVQDTADSGKMTGCMYGPELLIWLPDRKNFATFFFANPTMRNEFPSIKTLMAQTGGRGAFINFGIRLIENKGNSWHGPVTSGCSTPISEMPDPELFAENLRKFNSPPKSQVELDDNQADGRAR